MCCSYPFFRMDSSSALRIAVHVPAYVEACDDGRNVQHSASDFQLILDRDTMNLKELTEDVAQKLSYGKKIRASICHSSTSTPNANQSNY